MSAACAKSWLAEAGAIGRAPAHEVDTVQLCVCCESSMRARPARHEYCYGTPSEAAKAGHNKLLRRCTLVVSNLSVSCFSCNVSRTSFQKGAETFVGRRTEPRGAARSLCARAWKPAQRGSFDFSTILHLQRSLPPTLVYTMRFFWLSFAVSAVHSVAGWSGRAT
jgi:hypothetical protein